jgi:predicted metal-binding protein
MLPVTDKSASVAASRPSASALQVRALELGASDAAVLAASEVVTAEWVRLKCLYGGCTAGRCLTCPPHSPEPALTRQLLDEYERVLLLRLDVPAAEAGDWLAWSRRLAAIALALERELFLSGHYRAFALAGGRPCDLDKPCGQPQDCTARSQVRPGPVGCGIDVFATSANAGWPLAVVRAAGDAYHLVALVLID